MSNPEGKLSLCPQAEYSTILPALVMPHQNMTNASLCPHSVLPFETGKSTSWFPKVCAVLLALFTGAEGDAVPSFRDDKAALEYKLSSFVCRCEAFAKRLIGSSSICCWGSWCGWKSQSRELSAFIR